MDIVARVNFLVLFVHSFNISYFNLLQPNQFIQKARIFWIGKILYFRTIFLKKGSKIQYFDKILYQHYIKFVQKSLGFLQEL